MRWNKDASFIPADAMEVLQTDNSINQDPLQRLGQMKEKLYKEAGEELKQLHSSAAKGIGYDPTAEKLRLKHSAIKKDRESFRTALVNIFM